MPIQLLFVCLGNICRSPLAEGVFLDLVKKKGMENQFLIDSAGTSSWHCGEMADARARAVAGAKGIELPSVSRAVDAEDFDRFDLVLAMDRSNYNDLRSICPSGKEHKIKLIREFDEEGNRGKEVPDPYYGGDKGFERVLNILTICCDNLFQYCLENFPDKINSTQ